MSPFSFDTSGLITLPSEHYVDEECAVRWSDLSPGVQGCIAGMLEGAPNKIGKKLGAYMGRPGFSDLHPDTLARIIADWEAFVGQVGMPSYCLDGGLFWVNRQNGDYLSKFVDGPVSRSFGEFPPLTPYLNDDGKVCLKDASPDGVSARKGAGL